MRCLNLEFLPKALAGSNELALASHRAWSPAQGSLTSRALPQETRTIPIVLHASEVSLVPSVRNRTSAPDARVSRPSFNLMMMPQWANIRRCGPNCVSRPAEIEPDRGRFAVFSVNRASTRQYKQDRFNDARDTAGILLLRPGTSPIRDDRSQRDARHCPQSSATNRLITTMARYLDLAKGGGPDCTLFVRT
jgi:hypothetical protein